MAEGDVLQIVSGHQAFAAVASSTVCAGAGLAAPRGSLGLFDTGVAGEAWLKTGTTDTDWQLLALAP